MTYPFTEHATVLEGEVELTVSGGEPQRFAPGDSWFVKQGTEVEWKILTPRFVKHYGERRSRLTHADNPGARRRGLYSCTGSQIQPPFSTFRTIFIEPDANLNYDYPEWLFTSSHSLPLPILCRG